MPDTGDGARVVPQKAHRIIRLHDHSVSSAVMPKLATAAISAHGPAAQ
jgi:hypothetical protein